MELEDLLYDYLTEMLPIETLRRLNGQYDIENHLHDDAIEEIKTELFNIFYAMLRWRSLVRRLEEYTNQYEEEEEEKCEEEDNGDTEEET